MYGMHITSLHFVVLHTFGLFDGHAVRLDRLIVCGSFDDHAVRLDRLIVCGLFDGLSTLYG